MTPSLDQATSESYVWAHPACPVRILVSLNVIEQLQAEISQTAPWRGEIGGLLIHSKRSKPGTIRIVDFIPLQAERKTPDVRFKLPSESLAEAIARCPSDCKIAGFYRTDIDQSVHLRPEDLETIQQWFKDPTSVFLVIAAADMARSTAGFFFWENDSVGSNSNLTFPFSAAKLISEGWPTRADPVENRLANLKQRFWQIADMVGRASIPVKVATISALLALIVGVRVITWNRAASHSKAAVSPSLGLQVRRDGTKFQVAWNPSAPDIVNAKDANLVIWDGSRKAWDGSAEPLYMPLTPAQLRSGNVSYTSFAFSEKVKFRLDTLSISGNAASESMVSVSPANISSPAPARSLPVPEPRASVSVPQRAPVVPPRPAAESLPRTKPGRSAAASTPPRTDRPAIPSDHQPAVRSSALVSRAFVPPKSQKAASIAGETVMPDPPSMVAEPARVPASINSGFSPNAVAAIGPPSAQSNAALPMRASLRPGTMVAPPNGQSYEGVVTITSEPSGARVEINAIPAGVTPLTLQISPVGLGFTVTVAKSGFTKWTIQTSATAQPYALHAQLREISK